MTPTMKTMSGGLALGTKRLRGVQIAGLAFAVVALLLVSTVLSLLWFQRIP